MQQMSQNNQGAAVRFSNMGSGMIFAAKQGLLIGFLFTKDNLFDQAIAKLSGGNVGMMQQSTGYESNQANLSQMQYQQQIGIQNQFLTQQQQAGFMPGQMMVQMPGQHMPGQQMQGQMLTAQQRIAMSQQMQQQQQRQNQ